VESTQHTYIDLREIFSVILKKCYIILFFVLIFTGAAGYYAMTKIVNVYQAEVSLFVGREKDAAESISLTTINTNNYLMMDYQQIVLSRTVAEEVINELGLDMSPAALSACITVDSETGSRIFRIMYTDMNPDMAANIVNKISQVTIKKAQEISGVNNIQIIDPAIVPKNPVATNKKTIVIIAAVLGVILGIAVIFILEFMDYTFKSSEDIERVLGLNVLGTVPRFKGEPRKK